MKLIFLKKKKIVFIFTQRGREGEREEEKHQHMVASHAPPTGDLGHNPDMCPRLGIKPAILWFAKAGALSIETQEPGLKHILV